MNPSDELADLLIRSNARLIRSSNHLVYLLPNGRKFTMAKTPSDHRAAANQVADLRKALGPGWEKETRKNPNRKRNPGPPGKPVPAFSAPTQRALKPNPFVGMVFPSRVAPKYRDCLPVALQAVPMTPVWCWMRRIFGYGGRKAS